jgi:hypothetical protein
MPAKCPHCKGFVTSVHIEEVEGTVNLQPRWRCLTYSCCLCATVLGVQIDPVALRTETVEGVIQRIQGLPQ